MMSITMYLLLCLVVLVGLFQSSYGHCEETYMTFCDCVSDFKDYRTRNWTDVVIGSTKKANNLCSYSFAINSDTFEDFEEVKILYIVHQINEIGEGTFIKVGQNLKILKFYENNLRTIKTDAFSGFRKLSQLSLANNKIELLEEYAFRDSVIKNLDLSRNKIRAITAHTFDGAEISKINIRYNQLTYVTANAFNEHLEVLNLDYNQIENIQNGFTGNSPKLKELTLGHNKLAHVADLSSLCTDSIEKLDFSFNNINYINGDQLEDFKNLVYLDLSNNKLEKFKLKHLKKLRTPRMTLLLSYNLLTNLKMKDVTKPMTVTLFGNPWNCDCLTKLEKNLGDRGFTRTKCDLELFQNGKTPVCLDQGEECKGRPVQNRHDLQRFLRAGETTRENLPCDLFNDVNGKYVVSAPKMNEN